MNTSQNNQIFQGIIARNFSKICAVGAVAFVITIMALASVSIAPSRALAFDAVQIIDPFCLWSGCGDSNPDVVNYTDSNNVNSNVNSPGGVVNNSGNTVTTGSTNHDYAYDYNYDSNYHDSNYGSLGVSCYGTPSHADESDRVTWYANAYGGNGSYHYDWNGTDGLDGSGRSTTMRYNHYGDKRASVRVTSGNQTVTSECDNVVYVEDNGSNYNDNYNYDYNYNDYNDNNYYNSLSVSCRPDRTFSLVDENINWIAYVSGGNGNYTYRWDGTDNMRDTGRTASINYRDAGTKYATVRVTSSGRTVTRDCDYPVTVGINGNSYNNNNYQNQYGYGGNVQAACFADVTSARIGAPVTWAVEATGDSGNFTYSWSGSEGLTGNAPRIATSYSTAGAKSASVSIRSIDGQATTITCGNTVSVGNGGATSNTTKVSTKKTSESTLGASTFFSLGSVPWGWVAILVILVLFTMVMYLLYNKNKV